MLFFLTDLGGYFIYLFYHIMLCVNVQRHFPSTTFVLKRLKSAWWFSFLINAIFEHPLLWMTTNAFALPTRLDLIGIGSLFLQDITGNKLNWYHLHGLVSLPYCWAALSALRRISPLLDRKAELQHLIYTQVFRPFSINWTRPVCFVLSYNSVDWWPIKVAYIKQS